MKSAGPLFAALLILTSGRFAASSADTAQSKYVPFTPLNEDAVVIHGDIEKEGQEFVMRIRELRGSFIPPHTHPVDEHITVLTGNVCLGTGPEFDRAKLKCLGPGGYAFFPKGTTLFCESAGAAAGAGAGPEFDRAKLKCLGPGGYAFFPKGTTIFGESAEPATVQVHGIGPFHLHWKYPLQRSEERRGGKEGRSRW